jgi:hypothetical protein
VEGAYPFMMPVVGYRSRAGSRHFRPSSQHLRAHLHADVAVLLKLPRTAGCLLAVLWSFSRPLGSSSLLFGIYFRGSGSSSIDSFLLANDCRTTGNVSHVLFAGEQESEREMNYLI